MRKHTSSIQVPANVVSRYVNGILHSEVKAKDSAEAMAISEAWLQACPQALFLRIVACRAQLRAEIRKNHPDAEDFLRDPLLLPAQRAVDPEQEALYVALSESLIKLS